MEDEDHLYRRRSQLGTFSYPLNHGYSSTNIAPRTRQASRRISTELSAFASHQHAISFQKNDTDNHLHQNLSMVDELLNDHNQVSLSRTVGRGMQASNMYLAKAWFHSSQPMTRSRSSELRRRYAAMQNSITTNGMEAGHHASDHGLTRMNPGFAGSCKDFYELPSQLDTFTSPTNSSTSPLSNPQMGSIDAVSSVVSMLKSTLERKKLCNQVGKESNAGGSLFRIYGAQEGISSLSLVQEPVTRSLETPKTNGAVFAVQGKESETVLTIDGSIEMDINGFVAPTNPIQVSSASREPSQSESSAAAPVLSTGFEVCDGPSNSGQTPSGCESSRQQISTGNLENNSNSRDFRERMFENNLKDNRKRGSLARMGSVTSGCSVDRGDPTKKRRVERSRKMAEAKERNSSPAAPADMQSILKRCENLEKEVRSLKLNLSFMNRKDSEQTKQIEELQKHNEDLADEKERLLEEIERIIAGSDKM